MSVFCFFALQNRQHNRNERSAPTRAGADWCSQSTTTRQLHSV